jgi:hypothetical protein
MKKRSAGRVATLSHRRLFFFILKRGGREMVKCPMYQLSIKIFFFFKNNDLMSPKDITFYHLVYVARWFLTIF